MEWKMKVFENEFKQIELGLKTVEGRAALASDPNKNFSEMKVGDLIVFEAVDETQKIIEDKEMVFEVLFNHRYFKDDPRVAIGEMLEKEGLVKMIPDCEDVETGVNRYMGFPGYPERISKFGIHAIGLGKKLK